MEEVCQGKGRFGWTCDRKGTVERDGKCYCWQHDPERISRIAKQKWAARKLEIAAHEAAHDRRIKRRQREEAAQIDKLSDAELDTVIALGGVRAMIEKLTEGKQ